MIHKKKWIPQELYNEFLRNMMLLCVDNIVVIDGKVLLVKRKDEPAKGKWWFPGGRMHKGETIKEASRRIVKEETNLDCMVGSMLSVKETFFREGPDEIPVHSVNLVHVVYPREGQTEIKLDGHSTDYKLIARADYGDMYDPYIIDHLRMIGMDYGGYSCKLPN